MKNMKIFGKFDVAERLCSVIGAFLVVLLMLGGGFVQAQTAQKAEFNLRMVGHSRVALPWVVTEWFVKEAEARSNGRIKIDLTSSPELGLTGFERIRVLQTGLVDIGDVLPTFVSGELPVLEGQDLPGIYTDFAQMRKAHMAFHPVLQKYEERLGGKFLGRTRLSGTTFLALSPSKLWPT